MVAVAPAQRRVLTLLVDNHDSYTYNIFQMLAEVNGVAPVVVKNDDFGGDWASAWAFFLQYAQQVRQQYESSAEAASTGVLELAYNVVISPGPGHPAVPSDFGMCADAIKTCDPDVPLFGVCLGHQGLAHVYGGEVVNAPEVMHGRTSLVYFDEKNPRSLLFAHVPDGFEVVRYHSLVVDPATLPKELYVSASTSDGVVMALQHHEKEQFGVQFHPEAVCSSYGYQIFQNFRDITLKSPPSKCLLEHGDRSPANISADVHAASTATNPNEPARYKVLIDRIATGVATLDFAQHVFDALFSDAPRSFWLDSSNYVDEANVSEASSVQSRQTSCFSLMGDNSGPLSHCVEFSVLRKELRVHHQDGTAEVTENADLMAQLRSLLNDFRSHEMELLSGDAVPFNFRGGYVGYLGYEVLGNGLDDQHRDASATVLRAHLEEKLEQKEYVPDASLLFADRVLVFDHQDACVYTLSVSNMAKQSAPAESFDWHRAMRTRLIQLTDQHRQHHGTVPLCPQPSDRQAVVFHPSRSREQYIRDIAEVQQQIHDGETYEVCLTNQLRAAATIEDPLAFYKVLRRRNPAPYAAFYLSNPDGHFRSRSSSPSADSQGSMERSYAVCCSSPERFLRVESDGWMESKPIKGTRRRGLTPAEDLDIIEELAHCQKDRAENMMIADLVRNDFGRVAQIGSVYVPKLMKVESYATVHQLVTTVRAKQSSQADMVDVLEATFPGGSMTGAPKKRTTQIIRSLERHPRGVYSGALGFISLDGSCDLNIIIRTALVTRRSVSLGSGGAIVALSDCDDEYDEMLLKTKALVHAIGAFVTGRDDGTGAHVVTC